MVELWIEEKAKEAAGNWQHFQSFGWHGRPDDAENFCIVNVSNRDSNTLERANAAGIIAELKEFGDDVDVECHGHWAVGHVNALVVRVYGANGEITPAFIRLCELNAILEDYPVLDDELYAKMEAEEQDESWDNGLASSFNRSLCQRVRVLLEAEEKFSDEEVDEWENIISNYLDNEIEAEKFRAAFETLADQANVYWEDGWIDVEKPASKAELMDFKPYWERFGPDPRQLALPFELNDNPQSIAS